MALAVTVAAKSIPILNDEEWKLASAIILRPSTKGGRPYIDSRRSLEGMRWVASTGKPWADMPAKFGNSSTVRRQYARLKQRGVIDNLLTAFPKRLAKKNTERHARLTVGFQLACLQNLTERRPRGKIARAQAKENSGGLSPIGD